MPHITLEYTRNIKEQIDFQRLFSSLHLELMKTGEFILDEIKSRAVALDQFRIGDGDPDKSFVHLRVALLDSRSSALKSLIADRCLQLLSLSFAESLAGGKCQICVEMVDIRREGYFKAS